MKQIIPIITLILSLAMTSCQTDLELNDVIDQKSPFSFTIRTVDLETGLSSNETEEIKVNSEKWIKLVNFVKNNLNGWQSSPASHIGDIYVSQGDFRLIYTKSANGVVIAFTDKKGNPEQYIKGIDQGELDFLTE
tara:strand:- start:117 stop:521 length:405 start_codon:yes stop_codon:yes gene_type:complete